MEGTEMLKSHKWVHMMMGLMQLVEADLSSLHQDG